MFMYVFTFMYLGSYMGRFVLVNYQMFFVIKFQTLCLFGPGLNPHIIRFGWELVVLILCEFDLLLLVFG